MTKEEIEELKEVYTELYEEAKANKDAHLVFRYKDELKFVDYLLSTYED
ncbi:hypothetical protein [Terribacillus saccharophilus]|nr:hypothetical protein [Terribacillus saccharophilus]